MLIFTNEDLIRTIRYKKYAEDARINVYHHDMRYC